MLDSHVAAVLGRMQIRPRQSEDLDRLARVAREVHKADGYPRYNPEDDLAGFLGPSEILASWVAVVDDEVIGHSSLHSASSPEVMALAVDELGVAAEKLGVVARLLVDPSLRGAGAGRTLLETAEQDAVAEVWFRSSMSSTGSLQRLLSMNVWVGGVWAQFFSLCRTAQPSMNTSTPPQLVE
jgi:GNAT superfamily N-acetyltransferase